MKLKLQSALFAAVVFTITACGDGLAQREPGEPLPRFHMIGITPDNMTAEQAVEWDMVMGCDPKRGETTCMSAKPGLGFIRQGYVLVDFRDDRLYSADFLFLPDNFDYMTSYLGRYYGKPCSMSGEQGVGDGRQWSWCFAEGELVLQENLPLREGVRRGQMRFEPAAS